MFNSLAGGVFLNYNETMVRTMNFGTGDPFEASLTRISEEIKHRRLAEESIPEREILKNALAAVRREGELPAKLPEKRPPAESGPSAAPASVPQNRLPDYLAADNNEMLKKEIETLIDISLVRGVEAAMAEAGRRGPFFEDAFHDALVDKLLPVLKEKKLI